MRWHKGCCYNSIHKNVKVKPWSQGWLLAAGAYPGFCSMKWLQVSLLPGDGMLVHRRSLPRNNSPAPIYTPGWRRGTVRVKCLAQEHNIMFPARARTRTTHSCVEGTNNEATLPPKELKLNKSWPLKLDVYEVLKKCGASEKKENKSLV